jgi:L-rhamnose-H+ transport protein
MDIATGISLHAVGASCAALCYTPQKKAAQWSWQTFWLAQAAVCWLLLPLIGAWLTIPELKAVLSEAPSDAMIKTFVLGMAYGIGGTAFGIAIRYVGFSLTYAISVGLSCVLGTLLPPLVHGQLGALMSQQGAEYISGGMVMGVAGIALCGLAGRFKERDLAKQSGVATTFSLAKGLPLCLLAGVLSAVYGFALDQGQPIAAIAALHGAGNMQSNVIYLFSNTGAFVTTALYCLYLHNKHKTWGEYSGKAAPGIRIPFNFLMAAITGTLWYSQFFFYGLGHVRMGDYKFTSWAIHMIMLVLLSALTGLALKEWAGCNSTTRRLLLAALLVLVAAVLVLSYGNYLGSEK